MRRVYAGTKRKHRFSFNVYFSVETKEVKKDNRTPLNPIFNFAVHHVGKGDLYKGYARYTSTIELLIGNMQQEETMKFSKARAVMNVWLDRLKTSLLLNREFSEVMQIKF